MTDRDLLEAAARACGFGDGKFCWTESEYPKGSGANGALWNYKGHMDTAELWNPLTDDGDALRLAVKLSLTVYQWSDEVCVCNDLGTINEDAARVGDIYAATRRTIVRAAAALVTPNGRIEGDERR